MEGYTGCAGTTTTDTVSLPSSSEISYAFFQNGYFVERWYRCLPLGGRKEGGASVVVFFLFILSLGWNVCNHIIATINFFHYSTAQHIPPGSFLGAVNGKMSRVCLLPCGPICYVIQVTLEVGADRSHLAMPSHCSFGFLSAVYAPPPSSEVMQSGLQAW